MKIGSFIIPTGVGASIGGYAGDASRWARKFAEKSTLIVNPNVVNAACFSGISDNMLYVEGFSLDNFFKGNVELSKSNHNKIGVVFDKSIPQDVLNIHINTINAVKVVYGIDIIGYEITDADVGVEFFIDSSGASMGDVSNPETLKRASEKLIKSGAEAIAIVCLFPEDNEENDMNYSNGNGVDPVGGVEAIISHYISRELNIPCAHAPAFSDFSISTDLVDERCAAEYITPTFLPCILLGLSKAPKISNKGEISVNNLDFLVLPYNCIGNVPVLEMVKRGKSVYAVKENSTVLNVTPINFVDKCHIVDTYEDAFQEIFS